MINLFIGNLGHVFVILAFVLSLTSAFSYYKATRKTNELDIKGWTMNGRILFYLHSFFVVGIVVVLFLIIYNNLFEYHYAYSHASKVLPVHYMISCFWEGQEGSFLLWIFWNCLLGIILINPWTGPINLQDGSEFVAAGSSATYEEVWYLPLLLEGMEGPSE